MTRSVVITGAAGSIGQALCEVFAGAGYHVVGTDKVESAAHTNVDVEIELDRFCREEAYRRQSLSELAGALAGHPLAALINNAATQILGPTDDLTYDQWLETLNVNTVAPFFLVQGLLPALESGSGSVINISSIHAALTKPGFVCYATSKAALSGMTRAMAVDLGSRVRVNAIEPAAVATPMLEGGFAGNPEGRAELDRMHPIGRVAIPEEVARVALYLASEDAGFISGETLRVDGGIGGRLHDPD